VTQAMKERAAYVREREHYLQDILDKDENVLVE
jgi:hypothetical protein